MRKAKICIIISIILLFVFSSVITFAVSEDAEVSDSQVDEVLDPKKVLEELVGGRKGNVIAYRNIISEDKADQEVTMASDVCLDLKYNPKYFKEENNVVAINDQTYRFYLGYRNEKGDLIKLTNPKILYNKDDDGNMESCQVRVNGYNSQFVETLSNQGKLVYFLENTNAATPETIEMSGTVEITHKKRTLGETTSIGSATWNIVANGDFTGLGRILTETLVSMILTFGDSFLHLISMAVGEFVTIDGLVFGSIQKVSIDFFDNSTPNQLKAPLSEVIKTWYGFFLKIVILTYAVQLVYMGIRIILSSTANKKAEFKNRLLAWSMGVTILLCFPYVMKYTIKANEGFCLMIGTVNGEGDPLSSDDVNIANLSVSRMVKDYGTFEFIAKAMGFKSLQDLSSNMGIRTDVFGNSAMLDIRFQALAYFSIPLSIVYLILIGETIAILIMYYKRVFMLAFLITLFPLTVTFYALNKMGDVRVNSFGAWFKEFLVNVFVQAFHAATYVVVVNVGVSAYKKSGNWLFMIVCILFLFQGEKIIRAIFNATSSAGSIGDIAASGALAMTALKKLSKVPEGDKDKAGKGSDSDKIDEKSDEKAEADRRKVDQALNAAPTQGAEKNKAAAESASGSSTGQQAGGGQNGGGSSEDGGEPEIKLGREPATSHQEIYKKVNKKIDKVGSGSSSGVKEFLKDTAKEMGKKAVGYATGATASIIGGTFALAQHTNAESTGKALATAADSYKSGKKFGEKAFDNVGNLIKAGKMRAYSGALAQEYLDGKHDDEFVINEADEQLRKKKIEAYRKIAAKVASDRRRYGKDTAEKIFISEQLDTKK